MFLLKASLLRSLAIVNDSVSFINSSKTSLQEAQTSPSPGSSAPKSSMSAFGVIGVMSAMCVLAVIFVSYGLFSRAEAMKEEPEMAEMEKHGSFQDYDHGYGVGGDFSAF